MITICTLHPAFQISAQARKTSIEYQQPKLLSALQRTQHIHMSSHQRHTSDHLSNCTRTTWSQCPESYMLSFVCGLQFRSNASCCATCSPPLSLSLSASCRVWFDDVVASFGDASSAGGARLAGGLLLLLLLLHLQDVASWRRLAAWLVSAVSSA